MAEQPGLRIVHCDETVFCNFDLLSTPFKSGQAVSMCLEVAGPLMHSGSWQAVAATVIL